MTFGRRHPCLASKECVASIPYAEWACRKHRAALGLELSAEMGNAWRNRIQAPERYHNVRLRAKAALELIPSR